MHVCSQMLLIWINAMLQYQIKSNAVKESFQAVIENLPTHAQYNIPSSKQA
jgi:hypothetical protein